MQDLTIKQKLTNYYYFILFNTLLANIIAIGYCFNENINNLYFFTDIQHKKLAYIFLLCNHIWRMSLEVLAIGVIFLPTVLLTNNKLRYLIQSIISCIGIAILAYDTRIFYSCKVHITDLPAQAFLFSDYGIFTIGRLVYAICLCCLLSMEIYVISLIDKLQLRSKYSSKYKNRIFYCFFLLLISFLISQSTFYFILTKQEQYIIVSNRYWPLFFNEKEYIALSKKDKNNYYFGNKLPLQDLNYPRKNLETIITNPPNIIIIGIDAWRADYFNAIDTPNIWKIAKKGCIFYNHKSGANHTKLGLFSLFYALPPSYSYNFNKKKQSPVFIDLLLQLGYQFNFSFANSGAFKGNSFDKTIFNKIFNKSLASSGEAPSDWDESITHSWLNWYDKRDQNKPYFSFLFYFSAHENDFPVDFNKNYTPTEGKYRHKDYLKTVGSEGFIGAYKTSVQYVDSLIYKVIQKITDSNDLDNTIIIITSDHGRELDDNHQGCWTNGSNFTDCQIKVPCAIIGPKFNALKGYWQKDDLTTHYDIIPTIMKNFLGVKNDLVDYSIGTDLLDKNNIKRNWIFVTTYVNRAIPCAIVDENIIFQWFPSGFCKFLNKQNYPVFNQEINKQRLSEALDMMTRFLK